MGTNNTRIRSLIEQLREALGTPEIRVLKDVEYLGRQNGHRFVEVSNIYVDDGTLQHRLEAHFSADNIDIVNTITDFEHEGMEPLKRLTQHVQTTEKDMEVLVLAFLEWKCTH